MSLMIPFTFCDSCSESLAMLLLQLIALAVSFRICFRKVISPAKGQRNHKDSHKHEFDKMDKNNNISKRKAWRQ